MQANVPQVARSQEPRSPEGEEAFLEPPKRLEGLAWPHPLLTRSRAMAAWSKNQADRSERRHRAVHLPSSVLDSLPGQRGGRRAPGAWAGAHPNRRRRLPSRHLSPASVESWGPQSVEAGGGRRGGAQGEQGAVGLGGARWRPHCLIAGIFRETGRIRRRAREVPQKPPMGPQRAWAARWRRRSSPPRARALKRGAGPRVAPN